MLSALKLFIPLFLILGVLQAAVIALPFIYWRVSAHMGSINRFLFGSLLLLVAFVIHPLILIALITFTIAPTLLSLRHNITARASAAYTALILQPHAPFSLASDPRLWSAKKEWLYTLLGGYARWKVLGTLPTIVLLGMFVKRTLVDGKEVQEKGVGVRSERTDVQVVG